MHLRYIRLTEIPKLVIVVNGVFITPWLQTFSLSSVKASSSFTYQFIATFPLKMKYNNLNMIS